MDQVCTCRRLCPSTMSCLNRASKRMHCTYNLCIIQTARPWLTTEQRLTTISATCATQIVNITEFCWQRNHLNRARLFIMTFQNCPGRQPCTCAHIFKTRKLRPIECSYPQATSPACATLYSTLNHLADCQLGDALM